MKEWHKLILLKLPEGCTSAEVYFWVGSISLSSWADQQYANAKIKEVCPDDIQSVCLYDGCLTNSIRVAAWEEE